MSIGSDEGTDKGFTSDPGSGATLQVARAFESLGVEYLIGGSMASIVHGVVRLTNDADLVAELGMHQVESLA